MSAAAPNAATAAYTVTEFGQRYRLGRTAIYAEIGSGRLIARKVGVKTLILAADAEQWASALPRLHTNP